MLGIDRQHGGAGRRRAAHEQPAGANQAFLVGERNDDAALGRGHCRLEPGRPGDRPDHPFGRPLRGLQQRTLTGRRRDARAGQPVLELAIGRGIADRRKAGAKLAGKCSQRCGAGVCA